MAIFVLVFPKLENDPGLREVKSRPFLQVLIDSIGVKAGGVPEHYEPEKSTH